MKPQIKILYTGGTLGMRNGSAGLEPAADLAARVKAMLTRQPEAAAQIESLDWSISETVPLLDSANITPEDWGRIADQCIAHSQVQGLVIVHGTDTLAYSACALAYLLTGFTVPVIVTGSRKPLEANASDALDNLCGAMRAAVTAQRGVWVYFHKQIMPAVRVVKKDAIGFNCFDTPKLLTTFQQGVLALNKQTSPRPWATLNIPIVYLCPGFRAELLLAMLTSQPQAVVLALFGFGSLDNHNTTLLDALREAQQRDIIVIAVSQCYIGQTDFSLYAAGAELEGLGVISGRDMTLEAIYTKLMVLFHLGYSAAQIKQLLTQSIVGEIHPIDE